MTSRFNFTRVNKGRKGTFMPARIPDANHIRLTNKTIFMDRKLVQRVTHGKDVMVVAMTIETDPKNKALRLLPACPQEKGATFNFRATTLKGKIQKYNLHTDRPMGLFDMPNGNYVEDLKEENVFVLDK